MSGYLARMTPAFGITCTISVSPTIRAFPAFRAAFCLEAPGGEEETRPVDALQSGGFVRIEPGRESLPARIFEKA